MLKNWKNIFLGILVRIIFDYYPLLEVLWAEQGLSKDDQIVTDYFLGKLVYESFRGQELKLKSLNDQVWFVGGLHNGTTLIEFLIIQRWNEEQVVRLPPLKKWEAKDILPPSFVSLPPPAPILTPSKTIYIVDQNIIDVATWFDFVYKKEMRLGNRIVRVPPGVGIFSSEENLPDNSDLIRAYTKTIKMQKRSSASQILASPRTLGYLKKEAFNYWTYAENYFLSVVAEDNEALDLLL